MKVKVIVITYDTAGKMVMTTNMKDHKARIDILKAAILTDLKPNPLTNKLELCHK